MWSSVAAYHPPRCVVVRLVYAPQVSRGLPALIRARGGSQRRDQEALLRLSMPRGPSHRSGFQAAQGTWIPHVCQLNKHHRATSSASGSSVDVFEPQVESTTWYDGSESFSRAIGRPGVLRPDESPRWYPPLRLNGAVQRNASYPDLVQLCTLPRFSFCARNSAEDRQKTKFGITRADAAERAEGPVSRMLILSRLQSREHARRTLTTVDGT
mmetsp:Transcript_9692/g.21109  ORF Transcript_9692/g.21109 Transcript_9692/m.21109 type:complete len:212 (-) Transcript_9692:150-785(-)